MKGGASARGGWIAPGKNRAREVIEKYRSGSIRKSRVFLILYRRCYSWSERVGYIIYIYVAIDGEEKSEKRENDSR